MAMEFDLASIKPEDWQKPEIRSWAEPALDHVSYAVDIARKSFDYGLLSDRDYKYGENIGVAVQHIEIFAPTAYFDNNRARSQAFLLTVSTGLNVEAQNYNQLWAQPAQQEVA